MNDVYEKIDDNNSNRKILIVVDDMITVIMSNKKFQAIISSHKLFIRCKKLNISLVFVTQSYFSVPKDARLNSRHYLIMRINNKRKLQNIAKNHSTIKILIIKISERFKESVQKNCIIFSQSIQNYQQAIL